MAKLAKLYQRLRRKGYPWVAVSIGSNGKAKARPDATSFGVRYTADGQRSFETTKTLDEAVTILKARNVKLYASHNGTVIPEAASKANCTRTTIASAVSGICFRSCFGAKVQHFVYSPARLQPADFSCI